MDSTDIIYQIDNLVGTKYEGELRKLYVAGFLFKKNYNKVALVRKNRPEFQKGKLNGIGGGVESGETPYEAMTREFKEETGAGVSKWRPFCVLKASDNSWAVIFFTSTEKAKIRTVEDEEVDWYRVSDLFAHRFAPKCMKNLEWLIPMAKSDDELISIVIDFYH